MKILEIMNTDTLDSDGFVTLHEGMADVQSDRARTLVAKSKQFVTQLDDKIALKFKKDINKALAAFNSVIKSSNSSVRSIEAKLDNVEQVFAKYKKLAS